MMEMPQMKLTRSAARLSLMATLALAGSIALSAGAAPIRLVGVSAQGNAVLIESTEPVAYSVNHPDPLTVLVDMRNVSFSEATNAVERRDPIAGVKVEGVTAADGQTIARVRVSLARPAAYKVRSARNTIRVELTPSAAKPAASAPIAMPSAAAASAAPAPRLAPPVAAAATVLDAVAATRGTTGMTITLKGNGQLTPASVSETPDLPRRLVLDFMNVASKAPAATPVESRLVTRVRVGLNSREPLVTRVVMDLADTATYHVQRAGADGRDLAVVFEPAQSNAKMLVPVESAGEPVEPEPDIPVAQAIANAASITPPLDPTDPMSALKAAPAAPKSGAAPKAQAAVPETSRNTPATQPVEAPAPVAAPQPPAPAPPGVPQTAGREKKYNGTPITLDFAGVDLRSVLRLFSEPSGLNIIIDPSVQATPVDILLKDIPWDQALEIVLRANQLGYVAEGTDHPDRTAARCSRTSSAHGQRSRPRRRSPVTCRCRPTR